MFKTPPLGVNDQPSLGEPVFELQHLRRNQDPLRKLEQESLATLHLLCEEVRGLREDLRRRTLTGRIERFVAWLKGVFRGRR